MLRATSLGHTIQILSWAGSCKRKKEKLKTHLSFLAGQRLNFIPGLDQPMELPLERLVTSSFYLPLKGAKFDDDRIIREIHRIEMLFVYIGNIVVYSLVMPDVLNSDPCKKNLDVKYKASFGKINKEINK